MDRSVHCPKLLTRLTCVMGICFLGEYPTLSWVTSERGVTGLPSLFAADVAPSKSENPARESPKAEFMAIAEQFRDSFNWYWGYRRIDQLRSQLSEPGIPDPQRLQLNMTLSGELLRVGETEEAIRLFEEAFRLVQESPLPDSALAEMHRARALLYLRLAENENCVRRHNRDCCIFPLAGGGRHDIRSPAVEARRSLEEVLRIRPEDLRARWLLNIMAMALGEYPDSVPEKYLIPPSVFQSSSSIKRFTDVAGPLGVDTFNLAGGCVVDDFDNDGSLDVVTSTMDPAGPMTFYRNTGDGRFEDRSAASGLDQQLGGLNCNGADYDGDGDIDVLVMRGAWLHDEGVIRNSLLRNNGDGTFSDVTHAAHVAEPAAPTQATAWGDFDLDGQLDLYVCNESLVELERTGTSFPSRLYRNDGNGGFADVAPDAGVTNDRYCKGVAAGDYDNDGDLDLYVSNIGPNRLYRNNGDGTFTDLAPQLDVTDPRNRSFAAWFFDYDNDGWLDIFVAGYDARVEDIAADYLDLPIHCSRPALYHNNGDGTFTNTVIRAGLNHAWLPMGAGFGDLDNDGFLDIYLGTGDPNYDSIMPNIALRNDRGRRFEDVTFAAGLGHLQKGHGVAFADMDNDGDQDIYHQLGGFYPGDKFHNALFLNPGHDVRFLYVQLVGVQSNRAGYGARIRVDVDTPTGPRAIHRAVGSISSFGWSPRRQEIGLGRATSIRAVEVWWPRSNTRQVFTDVPMDSLIRITEDQPVFERLPLAAIPFPAEKPPGPKTTG